MEKIEKAKMTKHCFCRRFIGSILASSQQHEVICLKKEWAVGELLFHTKTPVVQVNRPDINDCPAPRLSGAKELCKKKEHKFIPSMQCQIDVCFGGKAFATEG